MAQDYLMNELAAFLTRAQSLIDRLEALLPASPPAPDWNAIAFRWRRHNGRAALEAVRHPHHIRVDDLKGIDEQKARVLQNTRQFVAGRPANNVLLTGARGTGKSSLVKGVLNEFHRQGLRLIAVDQHDL